MVNRTSENVFWERAFELDPAMGLCAIDGPLNARLSGSATERTHLDPGRPHQQCGSKVPVAMLLERAEHQTYDFPYHPVFASLALDGLLKEREKLHHKQQGGTMKHEGLIAT